MYVDLKQPPSKQDMRSPIKLQRPATQQSRVKQDQIQHLYQNDSVGSVLQGSGQIFFLKSELKESETLPITTE